MTPSKTPPQLPEPEVLLHSPTHGHVYGYTQAQMHAYAREYAQSTAAAAGGRPLPACDYVPGKLDETSPERVWLQIDTSADNDERDEAWPGAEHVTWQDESIGGLEVIYVRSDLHAATVTALQAEVERLRSQVSYEFSERELATKQRDDAWEREAAHKQRADAAERRVSELEGALHVVHDQHKWMYGERDREKARADRLESFVSDVRQECFEYWNEGIRPWPHHMQTLAWKAEAALTGAGAK